MKNAFRHFSNVLKSSIVAVAAAILLCPSSSMAATDGSDFGRTDYNNLKSEWLSDRAASDASGYSPMNSYTWTMDSGMFTPNENKYNQGPRGNLSNLLQRIADFLLIAIGTLAVLLIAVAGFRMATSAGNSDEATKGKTMVRFNLLAIVVSLMAYTIIQFVSWIISAA